jgi:two-component system phosphate regulon response regulator OmpR
MINKSSSHILIVDDDNRIRQLLCKYLIENNFFALAVKNANEARSIMKSFIFDLMILDVMMPDETGFELTMSLRKISDIPIIMLTAMSEPQDRITGLELGADDYLTKPFEPKELVLRINKLINRRAIGTHNVNFGKLKFNLNNHLLTNDNQLIPLTSSESKLLSIFVENRGRILSREELAVLCGGVNERTIDVQIIRLRSKIEADAKRPLYLQTIRGEGYILRLADLES